MRFAGAGAAAIDIGVLAAFLRSFLPGYRTYTLADDVLPPGLRVGAAGDGGGGGGEHGGRHQANGSSEHDHGGPGGAAPRTMGKRACAVGSPGGRWGGAQRGVALAELVLEPKVEFVGQHVIT